MVDLSSICGFPQFSRYPTKYPQVSIPSFLGHLYQQLRRFQGVLPSPVRRSGRHQLWPSVSPRKWSVRRFRAARRFGAPREGPCAAPRGQRWRGIPWHSWTGSGGTKTLKERGSWFYSWKWVGRVSNVQDDVSKSSDSEFCSCRFSTPLLLKSLLFKFCGCRHTVIICSD